MEGLRCAASQDAKNPSGETPFGAGVLTYGCLAFLLFSCFLVLFMGSLFLGLWRGEKGGEEGRGKGMDASRNENEKDTSTVLRSPFLR